MAAALLESSVRNAGNFCQRFQGMNLKLAGTIRKRLAGVTLTELLCVMAIIAILASMYLGVIGKTFNRVAKFLKGF